MPVNSSIPAAVDEALDVWLRHHDQLAPGLVDGLYLVGSAVLNDWQTDSDIDIVAFSSSVPGDDEIAVMRAAHEATNAELVGAKIDGPRLIWDDVAKAPVRLTCPWTLDGEFHHDDGCFELNPVIWHTLAIYGRAVRGSDPSELEIATDPVALQSFVLANADGYWRGLARGVAAASRDPERTSFDPAMTAWSVLGVARMLFTATTGDIASKSAAGIWLAAELPEHGELVEHALAIRRGEVEGSDTREIAVATATYLDRIVGLVMATAD